LKITALIARLLLGLLFVVFGLNGFLHFLPMTPPPGKLAGEYIGALFLSHYMVPVFTLELLGGALLLTSRFVPLALVLLGPVLVNILLFHALMAPEGLPIALLATGLWLVVFFRERHAFSGLVAIRSQEQPRTL
jgi:putative oxidoreductase